MRHRLYHILVCASMAATLTSCDNWFGNDLKNKSGSKGVGIAVSTSSSGNILGTRAATTAAPTNVYASADGDLTIEDWSYNK